MLKAAASLGIASAIAFYLLSIDRKSSIALGLVEIEGMVGVPLAPMLACAAVLLFSLSHLRTLFEAPAPDTNRRRHRPQPSVPAPRAMAVASPLPGSNWSDVAIAAAKEIPFPAGARLTFDPTRPTPIHLHLEHAPPERCKRAISLVGQWISMVPTPPRIRVSFEGCPEGGAPRHHQVSGALAQHLNRADFKAVSALDAVDVIFTRHDPRWSELRP